MTTPTDTWMSSKAARVAGGVGLLLVGPFLVLTAYFYAARAGHWHSRDSDTAFWLTSMVVGLAGLWVLPLRRLVRAGLTLPYVLIASVLSFLYSAPFVCALFGDCL